eukprot:1940657-Amphidinium_carterae.3
MPVLSTCVRLEECPECVHGCQPRPTTTSTLSTCSPHHLLDVRDTALAWNLSTTTMVPDVPPIPQLQRPEALG